MMSQSPKTLYKAVKVHQIGLEPSICAKDGGSAPPFLAFDRESLKG